MATPIPKNIEPEIKIEKGVPYEPSPRNGKYPWEAMQIGDSFFVETERPKTITHQMWQRGRKDKRKYASQTRAEGGKKGVRIWRLE